MTDTPRTDAECCIHESQYIPAEIARQLERELNEATYRIAKLEEDLKNCAAKESYYGSKQSHCL
jgi:hypothetical protein